MKVLFLDIDGVLNNSFTKSRIPVEGIFKGMDGLDERLVGLYLNWRNQRDCKVVLSSTWRLCTPLYNYLNSNGIFWDDITPSMGGWLCGEPRAREIKSWLKDNPCTHYAALDDMSFKLPRLVQTSYKFGLRQKQLDIVDKYLEY